MSTIWSEPTKTDITVERAREELTNATAHQARIEEAVKNMGFCCHHMEKAELSAAKKEVKRWSQWLADRQHLEDGTQASLPGM